MHKTCPITGTLGKGQKERTRYIIQEQKEHYTYLTNQTCSSVPRHEKSTTLKSPKQKQQKESRQ